MSTVINLFSADPQLAQLVRETSVPSAVIARERLSELANPSAKQPAVVMVDLRDEKEIPAALVLLKRNHPTTGVLLVASQLDPTLLLEAMRAGVNEFVTMPVTVAELQSAIKRVMGTFSAVFRGEIFAVVGAKGGVGATTVAINTAAALAKASPDSTLLIDLNQAFGDAAVFLGAEPRFSVTDALDNVQRLDTAFFSGLVVRTKSGVELLGSTGRAATRTHDPSHVRTLLDFASQNRPYTVLDVPRSDSAVLDSFELASKIVLVVNQELAAVRNASRMAAMLKQRYGQARLKLVVTRTDRRAEIGLDDVERTVGLEISQLFPNDYRLAVQAMNKGRPLVLDSTNELAAAFKAFAKQLTGSPDAKKGDKARAGSLLGRLTPRKA